VTQYEFGDEKLFEEEISLLYNIAFYGLSIGNWELSTEMWRRLSGLKASQADPAKLSDFTVAKSKRDQEETDETEDCLLDILTFDLTSTASGTERTEIADYFEQQPDNVKRSTNHVQDLKAKARAVGIVGTSCMNIGTKLNKMQVNRHISDLIHQASAIPEETLRNIITLSIHVGSVFVLHVSDQREHAIQVCESVIYLARLLIAQMPHYIYPYVYLYSLLPFLKSSKQQVQIESIGEVFSSSYGFLGQLFCHQYNLLPNDHPVLPFLAKYFKRPQPPDLSPKNELVVPPSSKDVISCAVKCTFNEDLELITGAISPVTLATKDMCTISPRSFTELFEARIAG
jgi:hypothetical protein